MRKSFNRNKSALLAVLVSSAVCLSVTAGSAKSPPDYDKILAKGYNELQINNKEKAQEIFQKAVNKYPESGKCKVALGTALKRLNKIDEAKAHFKAATEVEPQLAEGWYEYGCILEYDKFYQDAANAFEKYLELKPTASQRKLIEDRIRDLRGKEQ
jgi:Tetratricopeptide repeat.